MASGVQPGSGIQNSENDSGSAPLSWEGDKMFHIYIHDYCNKRGYTKTAQELVIEADIPQDSQPPINAKQGLLFEWWSVFWTLFTAKNNGQGPDEALLYTQHQANQAVQRQQNRNQPQQPINRLINGMASRQPGSMPPNGQLPNGVGPTGMPGGPVGMPNGVQGHMGFPMTNPSGHPPNGVSPGGPGGPTQPHNMQQMMPGQRPMGVGPQGQQNPPGMVQMGPGQHVAQMNRGMLPPNGPHNIGNPMGPTQQANSPGFQQIGRPSSRPNTPGQSMMPNPSPSMASRQPPNGIAGQMIQDWTMDIMRIPAALLTSIKQEAGLGDKDVPLFTMEEKQRVSQIYRQRTRPKPPSQQGSNIAGPSSTPSMQPANLRNPPQGRTAKRNSTSPGEEQEPANRTEGSPPDRKRMRPSPNGGEHPLPPGQPQQPQQQPQQQPPPMAPMAPFGHQQGGPGSRPMMGMGGAQMNFSHQQGGMHMSMSQGGIIPQMGSVSPGMINNPPATVMGTQLSPQKMQNYKQTMHNLHKNYIPPGALIPGNIGSPQSNPQQQGGGPQFGPGSINSVPSNKPMGGMMPPPPSPGMNKAQQPNTGKDGSVNPDANNRPASSPQTHAMGQPGGQSQGQQGQQQPNPQQQTQQQQQSTGQQSAGPGTAPQTPVSNPGSVMSTDPSSGLLGNSQQQGGGDALSAGLFGADFIRSMVGDDFDSGFLRPDGGDLNFERDFGQWFNPDEMPLDLK